MSATPLTWLYVPGSRSDRFDAAAASGADVVVVDWEDAVAPGQKEAARVASLAWLDALALRPVEERPVVEVRVNAVTGALGAADLAAIGDHPAVQSVRLPKVESAADVRRALEALPSARIGLHCLVESAAGVEAATEIVRASPRVERLGLGATDLAADLGSSDEAILEWCQARILVAARAAGLPRPAMSVWTAFRDQDGLAASCARGRRLGMLGRSAIHPAQLPVIAEAFSPTEAEAADARAVVAALADSVASGTGGFSLPDGRFVDAAVAAQAHAVIALAERHPQR